MARFEIGTYAKVIATGRIGKVIHRERTCVTIEFFDKSSINPETCEFKDHELMVATLPQMRTSQMGPFVRGEISLTELTGGINMISEYVEIDSEAYKVTAKDLLAGVTAACLSMRRPLNISASVMPIRILKVPIVDLYLKLTQF